MLIELSETNSHSCPRLPIDANQNQVVQNSHLTPWFWLMPDRSYNHSSYHLYFCWKLRMYCFVITFIFDETQGFPPKEGMSRNKLIYLGIRIWDRSYGPQSYTSSFIMGPWTFLSYSTWRFSHSFHEHENSSRSITKVMFILDISEIYRPLCQGTVSRMIILGKPSPGALLMVVLWF